MAVENIGVKMPTGDGGTHGHPFALGASLLTIHNPGSGETHRVAVYANNPTAGALDLTLNLLEGSPDDMLVQAIAAKTTVLAGYFEITDAVTLKASGAGLRLWCNIRRID